MEEIESYSPERHNREQLVKLLNLESIPSNEVFQLGRSICVAVMDEKIVGCIGFDVTTGEIFHLVVAPAHRGRHIARHLIESLTSRVLSPMLKASVDAQHVPFYEACGFMCEQEGDKFSCFRINKGKRCC